MTVTTCTFSAATEVATTVDLERYVGPVDAMDLEVVDRCTGPTLDVGCGPARFVSALLAKGSTPRRRRRAGDRRRSTDRRHDVSPSLVFELLPGEGRWRHVLLIDENVGIGGYPAICSDGSR